MIKSHVKFLSLKYFYYFCNVLARRLLITIQIKIAMKIEFLNPEVEVIKLQTTDVIATSPTGEGGDIPSDDPEW